MTAGSLPEGLVERCARAGSIELTSTGADPELGPPGIKTAYVMIRADDRNRLLAELARVTADRDRLREAVQNVAIGYCAMHDKPNVPRYDPEIEFCAVCFARAALAPEGP